MEISSIKQLFDPDHILWVGKMRDKFFATGSIKEITGIRPEILYGWKMTYQKGYRHTYFNKPVVNDLMNRWAANVELMETALPYMEKLHSFLQDESFWITLIDADGVILKLVGSNKILNELAATGLKEGSDRGCNAPYCGLFHLVYTYKKPFILSATEHASAIDDNLAGAACPIYSHKTKQVLGFIAISGHWWDSHIHTLGLAIISAEAISKQLALREVGHRVLKAHQSIQRMNRVLQTTVNSVDEGLLYCDSNGRVLIGNANAIVFLGLNEKSDIQGIYILPYIDSALTMDFVKAQIEEKNVFSCEIRCKHISLYCSIRPIEEQSGYIISLSKQIDAHKKAVSLAYSNAMFTFDSIIGSHPSLEKVKTMARLVATYDSAVLITGESGTGKEMIAQAIHNASKRASAPFIAINCGAIPRTLIEAELFGYEKGSFTGADKNGHPGKFELANGGTLFLDEIGDMPYDVQVSILRVLQTKEVIRIGGTKPIKIDVRIISATNRDLKDGIERKLFRQDLYYRLNVFPIEIPSLRERGDDIRELAIYFIDVYSKIYHKSVSGIAEEAENALLRHSWPGNIRELQNSIESAMILCQSNKIILQDLPIELRNYKEKRPIVKQNISSQIKSEKEHIQEILAETNGNIAETARKLQISRPTLYKRLQQYGITKNG